MSNGYKLTLCVDLKFTPTAMSSTRMQTMKKAHHLPLGDKKGGNAAFGIDMRGVEDKDGT